MKTMIAIGFVLVSLQASAFGMVYYLTNQWQGPQGRMCEYSNGTVLNVGYSICPLQING